MYAAFIIAAALGLVAAQTTTAAASSGAAVSGCGSQVDIIIQTCLATENAQLEACKPNDWDCLCEQSGNVLTCYNNCPSDPNAFGAQQTNVSYCNAAKAYGTSTSSTLASKPTASSVATGATTPNSAANVATTTTTPSTATPSAHTGDANTNTAGIFLGGVSFFVAMVGFF